MVILEWHQVLFELLALLLNFRPALLDLLSLFMFLVKAPPEQLFAKEISNDKTFCRLGVDAIQKGWDGTPFRCDIEQSKHLAFLSLYIFS
jgi:hypothetical protein